MEETISELDLEGYRGSRQNSVTGFSLLAFSKRRGQEEKGKMNDSNILKLEVHTRTGIKRNWKGFC